MRIVKIRWEELLQIVKENRAKHAAAAENAYIGWVHETAELLEDTACAFLDIEGRFKTGIIDDIPAPKFDAKPKDHLRDYDRLIRMIELTDEEHIELNEHEFDQYVNDEWNWKQDFTLTSQKYGG